MLVLMLILITSFVNGKLADSPWPTFHGNLRRTGLSDYDTSHIDGTIKWVYEAGEGVAVQSSPAIGPDGTIYVGIDDGYFYAFKELTAVDLINSANKHSWIDKKAVNKFFWRKKK